MPDFYFTKYSCSISCGIAAFTFTSFLVPSIFFRHCQILRLISCCLHREKVHAELKPPSPKTDFCSTTQKDFCVEGFVHLTPQTTQVSLNACILYICVCKVMNSDEIKSPVLHLKQYVIRYECLKGNFNIVTGVKMMPNMLHQFPFRCFICLHKQVNFHLFDI